MLVFDPEIFIDNKYYRWYLSLIEKDDIGADVEKHHRLPKSFKRENNKDIVRLSYRKHFLAHWLLTKCTTEQYKKKMLQALVLMTTNKYGKRIISSWQYAITRKAARLATLGNKRSVGRKFSEASRILMSNSRKNYLASLTTEQRNERDSHMSYISKSQSYEKKCITARKIADNMTPEQLKERGQKAADTRRKQEENDINLRQQRFEQRSVNSLKIAAARTPEERKEIIRKGIGQQTSEQRGERTRKQWASKTPEERSEIARNRDAAKTPEQLSERGRKGWLARRAKQLALCTPEPPQ